MIQKFLMLMAVMLLSCVCAFAQSDDSVQKKGDVNEDGVVDVADIVAVLTIMKEDANVENVSSYFYVGTTRPTAETFQTLTGEATSYTSINEAIGEKIALSVGDTLYMLCPTAWMEGRSLAIGLENGITISFSDEVDTTSVPKHTIYKTLGWNKSTEAMLKICTPDPTGLCPDNCHPHLIDLGLSVYWMCCNVGADSPSEVGNYYAWGETEPKEIYNWETYEHADGYAYNCQYIGPSISATHYDVAYLTFAPCQMPKKAEFEELIGNCARYFTTVNEYPGMIYQGPNGNRIFFPCTGRYNASVLNGERKDRGTYGYYWTASFASNCYSTSFNYIALLNENLGDLDNWEQRCNGLCVRPILKYAP